MLKATPTSIMSSLSSSGAISMEQDEYVAKAMFRADQREQLRYARDEGRKEVGKEIFALLESGVSLAEAKRKFGLG
jgi:hypothetical protein